MPGPPSETTLSPSSQHPQLVARDRRVGQPLEDERRRAHRARTARGAAGAGCPSAAFQPRPELVPVDDVRAAQLDTSPSSRATASASRAGDVADPDRLEPLRRRADRPASPAPAGRSARTGAARRRRRRTRSSDGGSRGRARRPHRLLGAPLRPVVRHGVLRRRRSSRARSSARTAGRPLACAAASDVRACLPAITRSNSAGLPVDDRDEMDDGVHARDRVGERRRVGDVAARELALDARPASSAPFRSRTSARTALPAPASSARRGAR